MYVPSSSDPMINLPSGVKAPHNGSSSSPLALERFNRPTKVLPLLFGYDQRREPATPPFNLGDSLPLAGPLPTRDTESAPNTGVEARMANAAA